MRILGAFLLSCLLGGCSLSNDSQQDDEKEPHYVQGRNLVNALDYPGAAEAFKEALEVNPRSAPAHYQLALLCESRLNRPDAAIYHYEEYLEIVPKSMNKDVINQHIYACKEQLISDVTQLPSAPAAQQKIDKLTEENRELHEQLDKWVAWYHNQAATPPAGAPIQPAPAPGGPAQPMGTPPQKPPPPPMPVNPAPPPAAHPRTHVVAPGETFKSIARKEKVNTSALEDANPGVNPKRLRPGQVIQLP